VMASAEKVEKGFNPFTGPVTDNTGTVRIPAGESWGGDKMGNFDWYAEGVIGKAK
jgi:basic membrane protein A and related proteins